MKHGHRFIQGYTHSGRIGVLVELVSQLSATAQVPAFANVAKDLAMHIAATAPQDVESLLAQPFVKDASTTVEQWLAAAAATVDDKIEIERFIRWDTEPTANPGQPSEPPSGPAVAMRLRGGSQ